jgi:hypothetical protein
MPGRPGLECGDQRAGLDQARAAGVHEQRGRFHAREVGGGDDAASGLDEAHVQRDDIALDEERGLARRHGVAVAAGALARVGACPHQHLHTERFAVAGDDTADPAVAVDPERLAPQRVADADLPCPCLYGGNLLRDLPHGCQDERPRQLGGGVRRRARVHVRGHDHAELGAGVDVDVRVDAALADQPQLGQPTKQRRTDLGALADEHEGFGVAQPLCERVDVLDVSVQISTS